MIFSFISPKWVNLYPNTFEADCTLEEALEYNKQFYNVYFFPNTTSKFDQIPINPKTGRKERFINASDIDTFEYCFIDLDMKDYMSSNLDRRHEYKTKQEFVDKVLADKIPPTMIVDSGNGVHVYWKVSDLDPMSFLLLNRRLCRHFNTDPAVCNIKQLLRVPGTINTKYEDNFVMCEVMYQNFDTVYDAESLSKLLPPISPDDEEKMKAHHDMCYNINQEHINVEENLPQAFLALCRSNADIKRLFYNTHKDRSAADYRLSHMLFSNGFSKEDAMSVFMNTAKAVERTKVHRYNYAKNIVDKVWAEAEKDRPVFSIPISTVKQIVSEEKELEGTRFPCNPIVDATHSGYRLGQVLGLIAGSGVGKTTLGLNFAVWFTKHNVNMDYVHIIVSLEQPKKEIALRWQTMSKVLKEQNPGIDWDNLLYILDNYNEDGTHRNLGWDDISEYILQVQKVSGKKVGSVIVDHIGLVKQGKGVGEYDSLNNNCKRMKEVAVQTNVFMIVQSQTSRGKGGIGDIELDIDAAFGANHFEWNSDYIMTMYQPLKRVIDRAPHMTVTAFKYAKIRKKNPLLDKIKPDVSYGLMFDPMTELLRGMTTDEHKSFEYWAVQATKERNKDKKREAPPLKTVTWLTTSGGDKGTTQ